jgi:ATP-binding cassette subfamily B protein
MMTLEPAIQNFSRAFRYSEKVKSADIRALVLALQPARFGPEDVVVAQDSKVKHVYLLKSGKIRVLQYNPSLQSAIPLAELTENRIFGNQQIDAHRSISLFSFVAATEVEAWRLPIEAYLKFISKYPFLQSVLDRSDEDALRESRFETDKPEGKLKTRKGRSKSKKKSKKAAATNAKGAHLGGEAPSGRIGPQEEEEEEDDFDYDRPERYSKKFPIILQHDEMDCAAASMAMISKYFGIDMGVPYFRNAIDVGVNGASMYGIASSAERIGLLTRGIRIDIEELGEIRLPAITTQGYHFVVVYEFNERHVVLGDPATGLRKISHEEFGKDWSNVVLLFNETPEFRKNTAESSEYSEYLKLFLPYRRYFVHIMLISVLLNFLGLTGPIFSQMMIDRVVSTGDRGLLAVLSIGLIFVFVMSVVTGMVRHYFTTYVALKLEVEMSAQFIRHLFRLPAKFFSTRRTGDTLMRLNDIETIKSFVTSRGVETVMDIMMLLIYTIALFVYDTTVSVVFVVNVVLFVGFMQFMGGRIAMRFSERIKYAGEASSLVIESIKNINTFKAFVAETPRRWRWEDTFTKSSLEAFRIGGYSRWIQVAIEVMYRGIPMFVLIYGAHRVLDKQMTVGTLVALMSLTTMALHPILSLSGVFVEFQQTLFGFRRLNDIFATEPEDKFEKFVPVSLSSLKGEVQFEGVKFRYGNDESPVILNGVSFLAYPGQRVGIVGRSGSGKTTITHLVNRLYDPFEGKILIDGFDVKLFPLSELRRAIGIVTQDTKLISGTIVENIALGDEFPDMARVTRAAEMASADEFVRGLPGGYFQPLFEDGAGLSGGQKQRIAIARALYKNPKVLIMDEATSALDSESEAAIQDAMPAICKDRTVLIIAHRMNTIRSCDQILVVDNGVVIESGSHEDLIRKNGAYRQLVREG